MAQLVAHHTGSVGVTGSNPVSSTREEAPHWFDCKTGGELFVVMKGEQPPLKGVMQVTNRT